MGKYKRKTPAPPDSRQDIPKKKGGAEKQSLYRVEYDAIAQRLVRLTGATVTEIAEVLGVSNETIYVWQARHETFRKALLIDLDVANHRVEVSCYQEAVGYWTEETETKQLGAGKVLTTKKRVWNRPNMTAIVWWTKVKAGWVPADLPLDPPPEDGKTITPDGETERQLARRIAFLAQIKSVN